MSDRQTTPLTPKAQHPERTQQFVSVVTESLESFEDSIGSLDENIKASAYELLSLHTKMHYRASGVLPLPRTRSLF